jgi:hypothetical protein
MATNIFDIVMVSWGRKDMTELAIMSINKHTFTPYRLTVIDNYSSGDMREMLIELRDGGLIDNLVLLETNIGLEPAKNLGMSFVGSDIFISTDNDCLPMKPDKDGDWLSKMVALMENNLDYGAIACRTQVMVGTGNIFEDKEDQDIVDFPWPGGSLRAMRKNIVDIIGGWRNDVISRGSEEKYICGEIHDLGYKTGFATHIRCYHMFGNGNWGYGEMLPEEHGHNPVSHPAIQNGDGDEIKEYL